MTPERLAEIERVHHMLPVEELAIALREAWDELELCQAGAVNLHKENWLWVEENWKLKDSVTKLHTKFEAAEKVVEASRMRAGYLHNDICGHVLDSEGKYECSCGHTQLRKALAEYDALAYDKETIK